MGQVLKYITRRAEPGKRQKLRPTGASVDHPGAPGLIHLKPRLRRCNQGIDPGRSFKCLKIGSNQLVNSKLPFGPVNSERSCAFSPFAMGT
jgi:hypothetical protein